MSIPNNFHLSSDNDCIKKKKTKKNFFPVKDQVKTHLPKIINLKLLESS